MKYTALTLSFFALFIILQNTSCTRGNKYLKEIQMLDSMQTFITKADSAVKAIDSAKITGYVHQVEKVDGMIQMEHADSMSPGASSIVRSFNAVRWSLASIAGKRGPLLRELEKSQAQMKHLSHDLHDNLVNKDSVSYYVAFETKKASELVEVSNFSVATMNQEIPVYNLLQPKADSLMSLLKDHKKF